MLRPWIADDGALVRLRLAGAPLRRVHDLIALAERWGDGAAHLTSRANVQLRGIEHRDGQVPDELIRALGELGLLPAPAHERVRNIEISPLSGRAGGRADVRPVATRLDRLICGDPLLAGLPGRFLFVLDDGRGDVVWRPLDLGLLALDTETAQLRLGTRSWGRVVGLDEGADALAALARRFVEVRGEGSQVPWHIDELATGVEEPCSPDPRTRVSADPWPPGIIEQRDGRVAEHRLVPDGRLTRELADDLPDEILVTPWRSLIIPDLEAS